MSTSLNFKKLLFGSSVNFKGEVQLSGTDPMVGFLFLVLPQVSSCSMEAFSQFPSLFVKLCAEVMDTFQHETAVLAAGRPD